jgi:glutamine amidotransferase
MTRSRKPLIAVVDYEMGNLHSVAKALEKAGGQVKVTSSPAEIRRAAGVVLPGVGAFGEAAKRLASKKLVAPILDALRHNKPFLGICLGLQLLFERSEENPGAKGLGFFRGNVVRFRMSKKSNLKVPHMGWNTAERGPAAKTPALRGVGKGRYFYFVHSFYPMPREKAIVSTITPYDGPFCSSVAKGRLFASQFHPEKSGEDGQKILRNFVKEVAACS